VPGWPASDRCSQAISAGIGQQFVAPWARRRQYNSAATILGWIAVFGIPYIGVQLMTLGGPAGGVDTAAVLVGYFGIAGILRGVLSVAGVAFTIAAGYFLGGALGDQQPVSSAAFDAVPGISATRRVVGTAFAVLSICLIATGAALLARPGHGNPMGPFLLADILWAVGMVIATPWRQPGPRFVRDVWLAPAIAAMGLLTIVGAVFPSDYAAAGLFFLPQLQRRPAARNREFSEALTRERRGGIAAHAV
jgi:hypothetical protein